jgi:hypothetical protein
VSDPEITSLLGDDASRVLNNPAWKRAWERMHQHIEDRELACKTTDAAEAADIIRCKQLLTALGREFTRIISEGEAAKIKLKEIEKAKTVSERIFKR